MSAKDIVFAFDEPTDHALRGIPEDFREFVNTQLSNLGVEPGSEEYKTLASRIRITKQWVLGDPTAYYTQQAQIAIKDALLSLAPGKKSQIEDISSEELPEGITYVIAQYDLWTRANEGMRVRSSFRIIREEENLRSEAHTLDIGLIPSHFPNSMTTLTGKGHSQK